MLRYDIVNHNKTPFNLFTLLSVFLEQSLISIVHLPQQLGYQCEFCSYFQGQVITFLDAHCECTEGWLEPLLTRIANDRTTVVCPIIDVISDDTFEYVTASDQTWGGFNWKLNFRWYRVPQREMERRHNDKTAPLRSPTMAGGLFSIDKDFFYEIGSYDEGMDIWGGENLEMSFRVRFSLFVFMTLNSQFVFSNLNDDKFRQNLCNNDNFNRLFTQ